VSGMLSRTSTADLIARLRKVAGDFADLHNDDRALPLADRHGTSLLLAIRPWEPRAFRSLRKEGREPVPAGRLLQPALAATGDTGRPRARPCGGRREVRE